jgi:hypothetical protein
MAVKSPEVTVSKSTTRMVFCEALVWLAVGILKDSFFWHGLPRLRSRFLDGIGALFSRKEDRGRIFLNAIQSYRDAQVVISRGSSIWTSRPWAYCDYLLLLLQEPTCLVHHHQARLGRGRVEESRERIETAEQVGE